MLNDYVIKSAPARSALCTITTLSCLLVMTSVVAAQQVQVDGPTAGSLDIQNFQPSPSPHSVFSVESAQSSSDLELSAGFLFNYANEPLVLVTDGTNEEIPIIDDQLSADLFFALGLFDVTEVSLAFPVYFVNSVASDALGPESLGGATVGDLRLKGKYSVLSPDRDPIGVAPYVQVGFPTGDDAAFTSSGGFYARPGLIVDTKIERLLLAVNLSANLQDEREFANLVVGNQLLFSAGAQYEVIEGTFLVGGELFGSSSFDDFLSNTDELPFEGLAGIKYRLPVGIAFEAGIGGGLVPGYGSPQFRVVGGIRYATYNNDRDEDGVVNSDDQCPDEPEDLDKFEDEDGCPDPDNDKDGIADTNDNCPEEVEDMDGFQDEDGCLDEDNDLDTVFDDQDRCPNEAGEVERQGCPDLDRDKDGFANDEDPCPDQAEDKDGFQDEDGCPEPDNDEDGVLDADDKCPEIAEDIDGFEDLDGCPEEDNDGDGIKDSEDKCPLRKGVAKWDGCPGKKKVVLVGDEIKILEQVFFATGKSKIKKKSFALLDEVADTIKSTPSIKKLEVQGHTDDVGSDAGNLKLSQGRAEAVRTYLLNAGVASHRLLARGYGESAPAVAIKGLKGRALKKARGSNRRVQFKILEQERKTKVIEVAPE